MDLANKETIKSLLRKHRIVPKKNWGQHFLVDRMVLEEIINAADLEKTDTVLEVGPGLGTLTFELARRVEKVIAVEKDPRLAAVLNDILAQEKITNVEVIEGDILSEIKNQKSRRRRGSPGAAKIENINKVVADIPYYLTSRLLRLLLEPRTPVINDQLSVIVLLVQREVAERICAKPPHMSLLAVSVQYFADPEVVAYVPKDSFSPQPAVNSAILRLRLYTQINADMNTDQHRLFFKIARAGFRHPRKLLVSNLKRTLGLSNDIASRFFSAANIPSRARAGELSMEQWHSLADAYAKLRSA